jgi:hypothetical protein
MDDNSLYTLKDTAVMTHEMFITYVEAGFTEHQALYLIGQIIAASLRPPQEG